MFLQNQLMSSTGNLWDRTLIIMGIVCLAQWWLGGSDEIYLFVASELFSEAFH